MARQIQDTLKILLPDPVVSYCWTQALESMTRDLSDNSKAKLQVNCWDPKALPPNLTTCRESKLMRWRIKWHKNCCRVVVIVVVIQILVLDKELEILQQLLLVVLKVVTTNPDTKVACNWRTRDWISAGSC